MPKITIQMHKSLLLCVFVLSLLVSIEFAFGVGCISPSPNDYHLFRKQYAKTLPVSVNTFNLCCHDVDDFVFVERLMI